MSLTIGVALAVMLVGMVGYLVCVQATKAAFGEMFRIAFWVGLFFVVWSLSNHLWRLS